MVRSGGYQGYPQGFGALRIDAPFEPRRRIGMEPVPPRDTGEANGFEECAFEKDLGRDGRYGRRVPAHDARQAHGALLVDLELTGTATAGDDYNASGTQITIAAGGTTGSVTVTAVQDELDEPDETVVADISAVTNGTESGTQQATTTITDDDEPQGFAVTQLTPTATGFQASFTNPIDDADLTLYDSQTAGLGPADVVLTGAASGVLAGSLVGMNQLGFALAFGVLLDTFVVRPILVPAYLILLHRGHFGSFGKWLGAQERLPTETAPTVKIGDDGRDQQDQ